MTRTGFIATAAASFLSIRSAVLARGVPYDVDCREGNGGLTSDLFRDPSTGWSRDRQAANNLCVDEQFEPKQISGPTGIVKI